MVPRKQAGHMTCTRPQAERQILLATRASSTHDPTRKSSGSPTAENAGRRVLKIGLGPSDDLVASLSNPFGTG
jgi:hypothetical protein